MHFNPRINFWEKCAYLYIKIYKNKVIPSTSTNNQVLRYYYSPVMLIFIMTPPFMKFKKNLHPPLLL